MLKTAVIGKTVNGVTQLSRIMAISGDKIILVDATTGQAPKKVTTKMVDKNLHIFADGATEPSVIVNDYALYDETVQISGLGANGEYVSYGLTATDTMELGAISAVPATSATPFMSTSAWWGVGILAVAGGAAAAAGGGGGGGSSGGGSTPSTTTTYGILVDSVLVGVAYTTSSDSTVKYTGADGSFIYKTGDSVIFKVGSATIGTYNTTKIATDGIVTLQDIVGVDPSNTTDTKVVNIAQFLQSLDTDNNPANGIVINQAEASKITTTIDVQTATGQELTTAVQQADTTNSLISSDAAVTHLNTVASDTTSPTTAITLSDTVLNSGETATVTIIFSEAVVGFSNADVTVANGILSTLSSLDNITWTATLTPTANSTSTTNSISIANTYSDVAGNTGTTATSANYTVSTKITPPPPPSLIITDDENAVGNIAGGTITYTFTFSDNVTGFIADDIVVTGGTKGTFSGSGAVYTLDITPTAGIEGNISVNVASGVALGSSGSQNSAAIATPQAVDMKAPTATIAMSDSALKVGDTSTVTITFSEAPVGFSEQDLSVSSGTLSGGTFDGSGKIYTATFTPTLNIESTTNLITLANTYTDVNLNTGATATSMNYAVDVKEPILTITNDETANTANIAGGDILYTFSFSEAVSGFIASDIVVVNGIAKTFTKVSDSVYTLGVTPQSGATGDMSVTVTASAYSDVAGNTNTVVTQSVQVIDMKAPTATIGMNDTALKAGDTSTVTITFSEEVKDFTNADVTAPNGTLGAFTTADNKIWTATFTPSVNMDNTNNAITLADTYTDSNLNVGTIAVGNYTVDTKAPTATITMSDSALKAGETSTVTVTFSEAVSGFSNADVTALNGTLTAFTSNDNITWTATFTPSVTMESTTNAITLANTYTDIAGNGGTSATSSNYSVDTSGPTATITMSDSALKAGDTSTVTVTFSEAVAEFGNADVTAPNGTLGAFATADNKTWTATFTPTTNMTSTTNAVSLAATYTDTAGNAGSTQTSTNYAIDTQVPSATIEMTSLALKAGETSTVTITFSEAVVEFSNADVSVTSGTLDPFVSADGGITWTATFTPTLNIESTTNLITLANSYTDINLNIGATATSMNYAVDTKVPVVSVTDNEPTITANMDGSNADGTVDADGGDILYTFTFTEAVTGFDANQITLSANATAKTFTKVSDTIYTLGVTPTAGFEGSITVGVDPTNIYDMVGNILDSTAPSILSSTQVVDMLAPVPDLTLTDFDYEKNEIILTLNSSLEAVTMTTPDNFIVEINTKPVAVTAIGMLNDKVTLILAESFDATQSINVVYKDATGDMSAAIQDLAGNDATSFVYYKADTTPPEVTSIFFNNSALSIGQSSLVTLNFSEEISDLVVSFENGTLTGLAPNSGDASIWTATFTPTANIESLSNVLTAVSFHDLNKNLNTSTLPTASYIIDTHTPSVMISDDMIAETINSADGNITYTFTFSEGVYGFSFDDIVVKNGTIVTGSFTGSDGDSVYTVVVAPKTGFEGDVTVDVAASKAVDFLNNSNSVAIQSVQTVDTKPLSKPVFALKTDSGVDSSDGITNIAAVNVTLDAAASNWEYSLDAGNTWRTGGGTSFNLSSGTTYAADTIQVRQYDVAGNPSMATSNSDIIVVDKTAPRIDTINTPITLEGSSGTITIAMDSELNPNDIAKENFAVTINGIAQTITGASVDGMNVVLTVASSFATDASVRVSYADLSSTDAFLSLKDLAGNNAIAFTQVVADTNAPTATIILSDAALKAGETGSVTITFSEAVQGFTLEDLSAESGVLSGLTSTDNITWTATFTPTVDVVSLTNSITLAATYSDTTGVAGTTANTVNYSVDTQVPTVIITDNQSATTANILDGAITYTFTFSEDVTGFTADDVTVSGGIKGAFAGSGSSYTLVVTPNTGFEGNLTIDVAANKAIDSALNNNIAATQSVQAVDIKAPTLVITDDESADTANIAGGSITYTFTFSESMIGFTADDINVTNGTKGAFSGSGSSYTLVVTPTTGFTGDVKVEVLAANQVDSGGNTGTDTHVVQTVDMQAPTAALLALTEDTGALATDNITNNSAIDVTGLESTATWEYSLDSGATWIAGTAQTTGNSSFNLANNTMYAINTIQVRQTDAAGNVSTISKNSEAIQIDTKVVTLTITDDESSATANMDGSNTDGSTDANGGDILYTFIFDEAVKDFVAGDIGITGGAGGTFTKISDTQYTLVVTPTDGYEGDMSINVLTTAYHDLAGNAGSAGSDTVSIQAVDMRAPFPNPLLHGSLTVSAYDVLHHRVVLNFDENLEQVTQANPASFGVMINGQVFAVTSIGVSDENAGMADNQAFLYLEDVVNARGELFDWATAGITVTYTHTTGDLSTVIQDLAGNDATSFNDYLADTLAPDVKITMSDTVLSSGDTPTVTFAFSEKVTLSHSDLDLTGANGDVGTLSTADGGKTWTGIFTPNMNTTDPSNVIGLNTTYTDQSGNSGIAANSGNFAIDTQAPIITTPAIDVVGHTSSGTITLHFNEALDSVNFAPNSMFYITDGTPTPDPADGAALLEYAVNAVSVSGQDVTLTVDASITDTPSAGWILTYSDASGNDASALQDIYGSDVSSFTYSISGAALIA